MAKEVSYESCVESGKKGGRKTLTKYGREHFVEMARKGAKLGGIAASKKYSHEHYQRIGRMTEEIHGKEKLSEWGKKGGLITASKQDLTIQEKKIKKFLDNRNIACTVHKMVKGSDRKYIVDFFLEYGYNEIIIEATAISSRKSNVIGYSKALDLVNRMKSIKSKNKRTKFIGIISSKFSFEGIIKLSNNYDCVVLDKDLKSLPELLRKINDEKYLSEITEKSIEHILKRKKMFKNAGIAVKDININESEKKVMSFLKEREIKFLSQSVLENKYGSICIVDFVVPLIKNSEKILEVTNVNGKSEKTLSRVINRLEHRFQLLKEFYAPKSKFIGIIDNVKQEEIDRFNTKFNLVSMNNFLSDKILNILR